MADRQTNDERIASEADRWVSRLMGRDRQGEATLEEWLSTSAMHLRLFLQALEIHVVSVRVARSMSQEEVDQLIADARAEIHAERRFLRWFRLP